MNLATELWRNLATELWLVSALGELCVLVLLLSKRFWKILPVFCLYVGWTLASDIAVFLIDRSLPAYALKTYTIQTAIDLALQFTVLVELAWSVLRPVRASLPRGTILVLAAFIALAGLIIWPLAGKTMSTNIRESAHFLIQLQQTFAFLRVGCFLAMASLSQVLAIGWKDRELQVATGLGFYSIVALIVSILQTHNLTDYQYFGLERVEVIGYLCSLSYWVLSFATKEQERKEFTPQMQQFLLLMGAGARSGRIALTDLPADRRKQKDK